MDLLAHLSGRHFDPARYRGVWLDADTATMALWNLSGQMVGYQAYRPDKPKIRGMNCRDQRYFTWISAGQLGVWGLETFDRRRPLHLCEGIFDACHIHTLGHAAIAMLANDPKPLAGWLRSLGVPLVSVGDGDAAGRKLAKFADRAVVVPEGLDPGETPSGELAALLAT